MSDGSSLEHVSCLIVFGNWPHSSYLCRACDKSFSSVLALQIIFWKFGGLCTARLTKFCLHGVLVILFRNSVFILQASEEAILFWLPLLISKVYEFLTEPVLWVLFRYKAGVWIPSF